jgi:hypothetical protein
MLGVLVAIVSYGICLRINKRLKPLIAGILSALLILLIWFINAFIFNANLLPIPGEGWVILVYMWTWPIMAAIAGIITATLINKYRRIC